jgi:predicted Zn-dependent protease
MTGKNQYLSMVDGLMFGPNPREGYVDGGVFYHPELTFQLPVPAGWQVSNAKTQVQFAEPEGKAAIIMGIQGGKTANQTAAEFLSESGASVVSSQPATINGYNAVRLSSLIRTEQGLLNILSYFIEKDGLTFALHGLTGNETAAVYQGTMDAAMTGFSQLTDRIRIDVTPSYIAVRKTAQAMRADQALMDLGADKTTLENHAVLNGIYLYDNIEAGTPLKIVIPGSLGIVW